MRLNIIPNLMFGLSHPKIPTPLVPLPPLRPWPQAIGRQQAEGWGLGIYGVVPLSSCSMVCWKTS